MPGGAAGCSAVASGRPRISGDPLMKILLLLLLLLLLLFAAACGDCDPPET